MVAKGFSPPSIEQAQGKWLPSMLDLFLHIHVLLRPYIPKNRKWGRPALDKAKAGVTS